MIFIVVFSLIIAGWIVFCGMKSYRDMMIEYYLGKDDEYPAEDDEYWTHIEHHYDKVTMMYDTHLKNLGVYLNWDGFNVSAYTPYNKRYIKPVPSSMDTQFRIHRKVIWNDDK